MAPIDSVSSWVQERLAVLTVPDDWQPNHAAARQRLERSQRRGVAISRGWSWRLATAAIVMVVLGAVPTVRLAAQRAWNVLFAREVSVLRVDLDNLPAAVGEALMSPAMIGGLTIGSASSVAEASARAGFEVRLARPDLLPGSPEMNVVSPLTFELVLRVEALERAARSAGVTDRAVRPEWAGVPIRVATGAQVIATYRSSRVALAQTPPIAITVPEGFDYPGFVEFALRLVGFQPPDAAALAAKSALAPMAFLGVPRRERVRVEEVLVRSGSATLIHERDGNGSEQTTLIWNGADRLYVLSGSIADDVAIAIANGLN